MSAASPECIINHVWTITMRKFYHCKGFPRKTLWKWPLLAPSVSNNYSLSYKPAYFKISNNGKPLVFFPLSSLLPTDGNCRVCANSPRIYFCLYQEMCSPIKCVNSHVYYENLISKFWGKLQFPSLRSCVKGWQRQICKSVCHFECLSSWLTLAFAWVYEEWRLMHSLDFQLSLYLACSALLVQEFSVMFSMPLHGDQHPWSHDGKPQ